MQFEVASHRMAGEFSAPIQLEPLPYTVARAADPADVELLQKQASVEVFTRTDGVLLAVFSTKWRLENVATGESHHAAAFPGRGRRLAVLTSRVDHPYHRNALLVRGLQVDLDVEAPVVVTCGVVEDLPHPPHVGLPVDR